MKDSHMSRVDEFARIVISQEMHRTAWDEAMAVERRFGPERPDSRYIGKPRGWQRYEGRLGERIFMACLDRMRVLYEEHPPVRAGGDFWDVKIRGVWIDVKTSRLPGPVDAIDPQRYGFVLAQEQIRKDLDLYVVVYLSMVLSAGYVAGFVRRTEVTVLRPVKVGRMTHPAIRIPLTRLEPVWALVSAVGQISQGVHLSTR